MMLWREVGLAEILDHFQGRRRIDGGGGQSLDLPSDAVESGEASMLFLDDGSVVVAASQWRGPYSDQTPDIDAEPPRFWIGSPAREEGPMMGHREKAKNGEELDAITGVRRVLLYMSRAGVTRAIKARMSRRARRGAKSDLMRSEDVQA